MKMAILGAGNIAGVMAVTVKQMKDVECYAIASRELEKAEDFAKEYGFTRAYGSYEEMLQDEAIELVYIATPHSHHYEHMKLCISYGKPVLCEKAFTANAKQAEELLTYAREKKVLVAEAIWTRYMPMLQVIREVLDSGIIGEVSMLTANLGYASDHVERIQNPALAGGALLDLGVYVINFASMIFGTEIERIISACTYTSTGVDEQESITIMYPGGKMAVLSSTIKAATDRQGILYGSRGVAIIENINCFGTMTIYDSQSRKIAAYEPPPQISGYEYEVEACMRALQEGHIECEEMPHKEIIRIMNIMDGLRREWGIRYPFET